MIQVFEPVIDSADIDSVTQALIRGEISGSFGTAITDFENVFASYCGCKYGVAVSSGTTALHIAVSALNLQPGDEILLSASTNIATALAVYHNNLVPIPVDSEAETWNMDVSKIESLITPKTKAIIPVHLFGHPVDMDALTLIAKKHNLIIIEDAAEAHGAEVRGKKIGGLSDMACFSFYANKIITTGEGGMVVTNNETLANELRLLRNLAFTKPRFWHEKAGYNFRMTGMQAALGLSQFSKIEYFIERKRQIASEYNSMLASVPGIQLPIEKDWAKNVYWMYAITVDKEKYGIDRDSLMKELFDMGIDTRTFFCPMNKQKCFEHLKTASIDCPVAEKIWSNGLYLPSSVFLDKNDIIKITDTIKKIRK